MLTLTISDLAAVLQKSYSLEEWQSTALLARLKHMQRLAFLPKGGAGRGHRAEYDVEHLLKVAVAFELLNAGVPSVRACRLVERSWTKLLEWFRTAHRGRKHRLQLVWFTYRPRALLNLGDPDEVWLSSQEKIELLTSKEATSLLEDPHWGGLLISPVSILERLEDAIRATIASSNEIASSALDRLLTS